MTMVDDGVAGPVHVGAPTPARAADAVAVPCVARPGAGLVHLDRPCQCFCGGAPPVFLDALERVLASR